VLGDVLDGFVSEAAALEHYGVAVQDGQVDRGATAARRRDRPVARAFHRREYVDALD